MTTARRNLIALENTPYYHCVCRCVRRAFLCGEDRYSGKDYEHRREWLVERIKQQVAVFAIDVAAYAVMSNHYHIILHVDVARAQAWNEDEIIDRWCTFYKGPLLIQRYRQGEKLSKAEQEAVNTIAEVWRKRLMDISWFMKALNELIARHANKEDGCKGRFWEGRFKSQALLDEQALLSCMAYVDLNPVRAGMSDDLETSDYTSIQARLKDINIVHDKRRGNKEADSPSAHLALDSKPKKSPQSIDLLPFIESEHQDHTFSALPFNLKDYIDLVDWTGRAVREDKRGVIDINRPKLLSQLGLTAKQWLALSIDIQKQSFAAIGSLDRIKTYNDRQGKRWTVRQSELTPLYPNVA